MSGPLEEPEKEKLLEEVRIQGYEKYILLGMRQEGLVTDISWTFQNPYKAGEMLGLLVHVMAESFTKRNPKDKMDAYLLMLEGIISTRNVVVSGDLPLQTLKEEKHGPTGSH